MKENLKTNIKASDNLILVCNLTFESLTWFKTQKQENRYKSMSMYMDMHNVSNI